MTADGYPTTTNIDGEYTIPAHLLPRIYTVEASKPGYYSNSTFATVTGGTTTPVNFTLQLIVGWIDGYVTDNATTPIANAIVAADTVASDTTDDAGYYTIEIAPGTYNLTASMSGYYDNVTYGVSVSAGETVTLNFTLQRILVFGWIDGTVTDASTGDPIYDATVTAANVTSSFTRFTNETGHYSITVPLGTYNVTASMSGYYDGVEYNVSVSENVTTTVDFALQPIVGWIDGTVTDASTEDPIVGATIIVNGYSTTTDDTGYYKIEIAPGTYNVTASADGYESSSQTDIIVTAGNTTQVDFELTPAQPPNILYFLYAGVAAIAIIIAAIAIYILKVRKPKPT